jgi:hypothetical protein
MWHRVETKRVFWHPEVGVTREQVQSSNLCEICDRRWTCVLRRQLRGPVLSCPEFAAAPYGPAVRPGEDSPDGENGSNYDDLCSTCLRQGECTEAHPPGGVWHCESYREGGGR